MYIDPDAVTSCQSFGTCNQFGCSVIVNEPYGQIDSVSQSVNTDYCDKSIGCTLENNEKIFGCGPYGCPPSQQYFELNRVCEENFYCTTMDCSGAANDVTDPNLECILTSVTNGNPLIINVTELATSELHNNYYRCVPEPSIEDGDPICEYFIDGRDQLEFDVSLDRCKGAPAVCDSSLVTGGIVSQGTSANGCDNITRTGDDSSWTQYDSDCVNAASPQANSLYGVYDEACCYAYSINNFDVYDNNLDSETITNGVRIY